MTWRARPDPTVARWWQGISHLIIERNRSMASRAADLGAADTPVTTPDSPGIETVAVTRLLDVVESERERVLTTLRQATEAADPQQALVQPTLAGSRNGGDILVHLRFRDQSAWADCSFDDVLATRRSPTSTA